MRNLLQQWAELDAAERAFAAMSDAAATKGTRKNQRNRLFLAVERLRKARREVSRAL